MKIIILVAIVAVLLVGFRMMKGAPAKLPSGAA